MAHMAVLVTTISGIVLFLSIHASPLGPIIDQNWALFGAAGIVGILYGRTLRNGFPRGH